MTNALPSRMMSFIPPVSADDARYRMAQLYTDINLIEVQLKDLVRIDKEGNKLSKEDFDNWQRRTRTALAYKKSEYHYLKTTIKNEAPPAIREVADELQSYSLFIVSKYEDVISKDDIQTIVTICEEMEKALKA